MPINERPKSNRFDTARPVFFSGAFTTPRYLKVVTRISPMKTLAIRVTMVKKIEKIGCSRIYIAFFIFAKVVPTAKTRYHSHIHWPRNQKGAFVLHYYDRVGRYCVVFTQ